MSKSVLKAENVKNATWYLVFQEKDWHLTKDNLGSIICEVAVKPEIAWKIFSKGITKEMATQQSNIRGKRELGVVFFDMLAVMA